MRSLIILAVMISAVGALLPAYNPSVLPAVKSTFFQATSMLHPTSARAVEISRGDNGYFALHATINDVTAPMVIDTGATSVVLTYETAKAAGLPLALLDYNVDVETAGGHVRAARLTLDKLSIGKLEERSVPALVVPRGQLRTNLLGMSFLNRLESWEVRPDRLMLRGYP